jgi:ABC-2 type transport system permease protein
MNTNSPWLVRREFWENRAIWMIPAVFGGLLLLAALFGRVSIPQLTSPQESRAAAAAFLGIIGASFFVVMSVYSTWYLLDCLYTDRRDRSILFWKSLPVSDVTTVLAKACVPLVILPLLTFAITVAMQWLMLLLSSAVLLVSGQSVATLWTKLSFLRMSWLLLYHILTAHALWPAPIYCWLLLVSGWPRRAAFLWAALPLVAIAGVEQIAFHTWHFAAIVGSRLMGATTTVASTSPDMFPTDSMTHIAPVHFLSSPGLWIGLALAAVFLAAAVRLRRYREPI